MYSVNLWAVQKTYRSKENFQGSIRTSSEDVYWNHECGTIPCPS